MINVTTTAAKKICQQLEKRKKSIGIRVGVKTTGCSGLAYVLEYVDESADMSGDTNHQFDGFCVIVNAKHQPYVNNMTIDYVRQGLNEGFEFRNPNERDRCGCGESFRV